MEATPRDRAERKAALAATVEHIELKRKHRATGWGMGARGLPVSSNMINCLAYLQGWVNGRELYNQNVHGVSDGSDPVTVPLEEE